MSGHAIVVARSFERFTHSPTRVCVCVCACVFLVLEISSFSISNEPSTSNAMHFFFCQRCSRNCSSAKLQIARECSTIDDRNCNFPSVVIFIMSRAFSFRPEPRAFCLPFFLATTEQAIHRGPACARPHPRD